MTGYVGATGGRKKVASMYIGTAAGRKQVEKAYIGTPSGNRLWYERFALTTALTAAAASTSQINLSWTASQGCTYQLHRTAGPTTGPLPNGSTALAYSDMGLPPNTTCSYRLDVYRNGVLVGSPTASAKTAAVTTQQKTVTLEAVSSASYNGSGANRNTADAFYGWYSDRQGTQESLWCFNIPADVRNCVSVDRIDVRVYNIHAYSNSGGTVGLVVHHGAYQAGFPASFPGRTGLLELLGRTWLASTPKPGYMSGGNNDGDGWMLHCQNLVAPGRTTLAEEFRVNGATGMGLAAPSSSTNHYGYAAGATAVSGRKPAMRLTYTIRTA